MQVVAMETETETGEMIVKRVSVPIGLEELMEGLTKEILLKKPDDIYSFAAEYFSQLLLLREKGGYKVKPARSAQSISKQIPKKSAEKLLIRGASKQLSRQLSVRGESPVKKDAPTRRFPTRRVQTEDQTLDRTKYIDRRNKFKKVEPDTKDADTKPKRTPATTPRAPSNTSEDKQNTLAKRDRSLSTSRRGRSVTKNVQVTPRQRSTTTPRRAQNSSESNKTEKSPRSSELKKSQKDDSQKTSKSESKDVAAVPKVSSVEETQEFVKDGKLTVIPPKVIKRPQSQSSQELISSLPVPQLLAQILPTENNSIKNENKEKSTLVAEEDKKEDLSSSPENKVAELKKDALSDDTQKEELTKPQMVSLIASTEKDDDVSESKNGAKKNTDIVSANQAKNEGENRIRNLDEDKKKAADLTNDNKIDAVQKDEKEEIAHETKDPVDKTDKDSENIDSTDNVLVEQSNVILDNDKSVNDNCTTITSEFSESDNKSNTNDKDTDRSIDSTISEIATKSLDKIDSQNKLPDRNHKVISSENNDTDKSEKGSNEGDNNTEHSTSVNITKSLSKKDSQKILTDEDNKANLSENGDMHTPGKGLNEGKSLDTKDSGNVLVDSEEKLNMSESDVANTSGKNLILTEETKQDEIGVEKTNMKSSNDKDKDSEKLEKKEDESIEKHGGASELEEQSETVTVKSSGKLPPENVKNETEKSDIFEKKYEKEEINKENEGKSDKNVDNKILEQIKEEAILKTDSKYSVAAAKGKDLEKTDSESKNTSIEITDIGEPELITPQDTERCLATANKKVAKEIETEIKDIKSAHENTKEGVKNMEDNRKFVAEAVKEEAKSIQSEIEKESDKEHKDFRKDPSKMKVVQDAENDYLREENMTDHKKIEGAKQEIENKAIRELAKKDLNNIKPINDNLAKTTSKSTIEGDKNPEKNLELGDEKDEHKNVNIHKTSNNSALLENAVDSDDKNAGEVLVQEVETEQEKDKSMKNIRNLDAENADMKTDTKESILKPAKKNQVQPVSAIVEGKVTDLVDKELTINTFDQGEDTDNIQHSEKNTEDVEKTDILKANEVNREKKNINTEIVSTEEQQLIDNAGINNENTVNNTENLAVKDVPEKEEIKHTEVYVASEEPKVNDIKHGEGLSDSKNIKHDKEEHADNPQLSKSESEDSNRSLPVDVEKSENKTKQKEEVNESSTENNISDKVVLSDLEKHEVEGNLGMENGLNPKISKENKKINQQENIDIEAKDKTLNSDQSKEDTNVNKAEDKQKEIQTEDNDILSTVSDVDKPVRESDTEHKTLKDSNSSDTISDTGPSDMQHTDATTDDAIESDSNERNLETSRSPGNTDVIKNVINSVLTAVKEGPVDQVVKKYIGDFIHNEKENVFILKPDQVDTEILNKDTNDKQRQAGEKAEEILVKTKATLDESTNKLVNSGNTEDKEPATINSNMQNVIDSTLMVSKTGTVDAIVKDHINDFLHNEKQHVFRETNELDSHSLTKDENLVIDDENKLDGKRISVAETESKAEVNTNEATQPQEDVNKFVEKETSVPKTDSKSEVSTKQDNQPQNTKQRIANKKSRALSQTHIQAADSNLKQNNKTKGERKLRRVKTVDVITDENKPKAEIKSRIPTADYRHRVKRDIDSGKHSIRIQQKPNANEGAKILPSTVNTLAKDNSSQNEVVNTTAFNNGKKNIDDQKQQIETKDLGLVEGATPEKTEIEMKVSNIETKLEHVETILQTDTETVDEKTANKLENAIVDKVQPETKFDTSKLREELKTVENESKLSTFKSTFNPYILRQEIKNTSQFSNDSNDDISKNTLKYVLTPLTAALKIQSLWRGFKVRRNKVIESPAAESVIVAKEALALKSDTVLEKSNANVENIDEDNGKIAESSAAESIILPEESLSLKSDTVLKKSVNTEDREAGEENINNGDTLNHKKMLNEVAKETILPSSSSEIIHQNNALPQENQSKNHILNVKSEKSLPESEYARALNENFVNAAITIQKIWRGFKIRKSNKENKKVDKGGDNINGKDNSKPTDHGVVGDVSKLEIKQSNKEIEPDSLENNLPVTDMKLESAAITIQRIWRGFHIRKIRSNTQKKPQVADLQLSSTEFKEDSKEATLASKEEVITKSSVNELKTEFPPLHSNTESQFVDAAILIQRMWRGFKVRKCVNERKEKDVQLSKKLQSNQDTAEGRKDTADDTNKQLHTHLEKQPSVENEKFIKAATTIQKIWRGFKVRKTMKMGNLFGTTVEAEKPIIESIEAVKTTDPKDKKSALKIQSLWRGYQVRKNINIIKNKLDDKITTNDEGQGKELNDGDILNAATKIQAGVRGYLERKRYKNDGNNKDNGNNLKSITEERTNESDNTKNTSLNEKKIEKVNGDNKTTNLGVRKMSEDEVLKALEGLNKVVIPIDSPIKEPNKPSLYRRNTFEEPDIIKKQNAPLVKSTSLNHIISLQDENKDAHATETFKDRNNNSSEKYAPLTPLEIETKEAIEDITNKKLLVDNTSAELNDENKSDSMNILNDNKSNKPNLIGQQNNTDPINTKALGDTEVSNLEKVTTNESGQKSNGKPLPSNDIKDNTDEIKDKDFITESKGEESLTQERKVTDKKEDNELNDDNEESEADSLSNADIEINNDEKPKYERPMSIDSTDSAITVIYNEAEEQEDNDENRGKISDDIPKAVPKIDTVVKVPLLEHEQLINDLQNKLLDQISGKNRDASAESISTKFDIELLRKELEDVALLYNPQESRLMHQNSKEEVNDQLLDYLTYKPYEKKQTDNSLLNTSINKSSRDLPDITEEDSEAKSMEDSDISDDVFENNSSLQTENASIKENILSSEDNIEKIQSTLKECEKLAQEINLGIHNFETVQDSKASNQKSIVEGIKGDDLTSKQRENCTDQPESSFCKIPNGTLSQTKYIDNKPLLDHVEYIDKAEGSENSIEDKLRNGKGHNREVDSIPTDLSASKDSETNSSSSNKLLHTGELHDSVIVPLLLSSQDSQASASVENTSTKSSSEDVPQTSPSVHSKLLHTGELHDSVIVPLPLAVQNSLKSEQEKYGCNTGIPENQVQQSNLVDASSLSSAADAVNSAQQLESSRDIVGTSKGLLHTGELHDTVLVPLSLEAQHYPNEEKRLIQKASNSEVLNLTDLTEDKHANDLSELPSNLTSSEELHDSVVAPLPLEAQHDPSEEKCLTQKAFSSPQTESAVLNMTDLSEQMNAPSGLPSKPKSPPKASGLVHTGELHDTVVIPGTITEDVEDEAASEQKGKVLRQVDSECQTSGGANVLPIEVHLNQAPGQVFVIIQVLRP